MRQPHEYLDCTPYLGACVLVEWAYAPDWYGATVAWLYLQEPDELVLFSSAGTEIPATHGDQPLRIRRSGVERIREVWLTESLRDLNRLYR